MTALQIQLDAPLPAELAAGPPTAVFVAGTCFAPGERIASLELEVDGEFQPLLAHGMPLLDHLHVLGDPAAYASGFWGLARLEPRHGAIAIGLRAHLQGGGEARAQLGRIGVTALPAPLPGAPEVAICMATHEPPPDLLALQLDSIRAQTHTDWVCVISDDASSPTAFARLEALVGGDPRFAVSRSPRRLGFYRNFERALALAPRGARTIALADQDDAWDSGKLATLAAALGDAQLVYSDARIVRPDGALVAPTYWSRRRNNHANLLSLLVANAVTGAASLFRRDLLEVAMPFPPAQFAHFHDHWLGLCALALGEIRFVDRPLYDYVQHEAAALGHERANRMPSARDRLAALRRDPRERVRLWRMHYFLDACRLMQVATILLARCGDRMPARRRRALEGFLHAEDGLVPVLRLGARGARELTRRRPETLGAEWMLAHAFTWRRLLEAGARDRPQRRLRLDAVPPPGLDPAPGAAAPAQPEAQALAEKVAPLRLAAADDAPRRVNVLIPTVDLQHFFGGYIAKFNFARRLAERGHRVRIVTVDPTGPLPADWRRRVEDYRGLAGVLDRVEVAFGREAGSLEISPDDAFVATTWWTAHVAADALGAVRAERFLYLIQEYEPFTFPMGSHAALADGSYALPHAALFSTELLRAFFRARGLGVYAGGAAAGDRASAAFRNAITPVAPAGAAELAARRPRRLLFYARPEPHAARNMFEVGVLALGRAAVAGAFAGEWVLQGIGTVRAGRRVELGAGARLELLPRAAQGDYAGVLRAHDVGLALMYTPHPSLVPLEMAAAGMLTVTNSYANKTAESLAAISANLLCAPPTVHGIADALCTATAAAGDVERRLAGSRVAWSRDWDECFDDALMERIEGLFA